MPRPFAPSTPGSAVVRSLEDLGQRIRHARVSQGIRIDDAAARCQVATGVLSRVENGKPVKSDGLLRVLGGLGLSVVVVDHAKALSLEAHLGELDGKTTAEGVGG